MEKLPSKFQPEERVYVDLGQAGAFDAFVLRVHFTKSKVSYDVIVDVGVNGDEILKTRLYNVDSVFVTEPTQENYDRLFNRYSPAEINSNVDLKLFATRMRIKFGNSIFDIPDSEIDKYIEDQESNEKTV